MIIGTGGLLHAQIRCGIQQNTERSVSWYYMLKSHEEKHRSFVEKLRFFRENTTHSRAVGNLPNVFWYKRRAYHRSFFSKTVSRMAARYLFVNDLRRDESRQRRRRGPNPLQELSDEDFLKEYRMTKGEVNYLCNLLKDDLSPRGRRLIDLTVQEKVLISLKTLASGSFQNSSKDALNVSQPTVSVVLDQFVNALNKKAPQFIYMPRNDDEMDKTKTEFYNFAGFPGVIGCIDGTHVPIIAPPEDEYVYVNRRKFHSINVMAVCDAQMVLTSVVAKWPGSSHDSFILNTSSLNTKFESGHYGRSWLLGDSGYALKSWLITPLKEPSTPKQRRFNRSHKKTRSLIERTFGILKSRWRILDHTGGRMCYLPQKAAKIFMCCSILHNICRRNGTPIVDAIVQNDNSMDMEEEESSSSDAGLRQRQRLIDLF